MPPSYIIIPINYNTIKRRVQPAGCCRREKSAGFANAPRKAAGSRRPPGLPFPRQVRRSIRCGIRRPVSYAWADGPAAPPISLSSLRGGVMSLGPAGVMWALMVTLRLVSAVLAVVKSVRLPSLPSLPSLHSYRNDRRINKLYHCINDYSMKGALPSTARTAI
jgi:hypothetical protein